MFCISALSKEMSGGSLPRAVVFFSL